MKHGKISKKFFVNKGIKDSQFPENSKNFRGSQKSQSDSQENQRFSGHKKRKAFFSVLGCANCGSNDVELKKVDFRVYGISLGKFEAEVCNKCGEEIFSEEVSDRMDIVAKEKGLWGLEAITKVAKSGDSLVIRVNKKLADFLGLKKGEEITLVPEGKKRLVVEI